MYARELERNARQDSSPIAHCLDNLPGAIRGDANPAQMKLVEVRAWTR